MQKLLQISLCTRLTAIRFDSLAQQVEHNTFNVGVLGSSPKRITGQCFLEHCLFYLSISNLGITGYHSARLRAVKSTNLTVAGNDHGTQCNTNCGTVVHIFS